MHQCLTIGSQSIVASVQGDCSGGDDISDTNGIMDNTLEFTVVTDEEGDLEITCPDLRHQLDYVCHAWDLTTRAPQPVDDAVVPHSIELAGARLGLHVEGGYLLKCTLVCQKASLFRQTKDFISQ